jgi:hypothetical protein
MDAVWSRWVLAGLCNTVTGKLNKYQNPRIDVTNIASRQQHYKHGMPSRSFPSEIAYRIILHQLFDFWTLFTILVGLGLLLVELSRRLATPILDTSFGTVL